MWDQRVAFAIYSINRDGLELLEISGTAGTVGGYVIHVFVAGDINNDGAIDGTDAALEAQALGTLPGQPSYIGAADINRDGAINAADVHILAAGLGFEANRPPVITPPAILTHQDLTVTTNLSALATDPEGDPLLIRVTNAQHGTATLVARRKFCDLRANPRLYRSGELPGSGG